jgi:hypothetical protein
MSETQFYISVAVMPVTTIIIVLIGVLLNNNNMNNRLSDVNNRLNDLKELLRAEIAKSHSVLLMKFAELDQRLTRIEAHLSLR